MCLLLKILYFQKKKQKKESNVCLPLVIHILERYICVYIYMYYIFCNYIYWVYIQVPGGTSGWLHLYCRGVHFIPTEITEKHPSSPSKALVTLVLTGEREPSFIRHTEVEMYTQNPWQLCWTHFFPLVGEGKSWEGLERWCRACSSL